MHWVIEGKRDREIAIILGLSPRTVEKHVCHILEKLGVETRTAAVSECSYSQALSQTFPENILPGAHRGKQQ
jgi:DNA-binding CsgD family transcriptional regulator